MFGFLSAFLLFLSSRGCSLFENCKTCHNGTWKANDDFFINGKYCTDCRQGWSGGDCKSESRWWITHGCCQLCLTKLAQRHLFPITEMEKHSSDNKFTSCSPFFTVKFSQTSGSACCGDIRSLWENYLVVHNVKACRPLNHPWEVFVGGSSIWQLCWETFFFLSVVLPNTRRGIQDKEKTKCVNKHTRIAQKSILLISLKVEQRPINLNFGYRLAGPQLYCHLCNT